MLHHTNLHFKEELEYRYVTKYIILHHSEDSKPHTVEDIHRLHKRKGMAGIGYHYFIKKDGEIYEGRPYGTIGAHTRDFNSNSIGIGFEGDFNKETMCDIQLDAAVMLISLLRLANSHYGDFPELKMCRDLKNGTDDPGKNFPYDKLRRKVEECEKYVCALFGDQSCLADDRSEIGNFDYENIIDLFDDIHDHNDLE